MSAALSTLSARAASLDAEDPLRAFRDRFVGAETDLVYFDGNSLGRPLRATADRLRDFVLDQWGARLIRGWDEGWYDLPLTVGDEIADACLGAEPGQTVVADSTTVLLYKAIRAAVAMRAGRDEIVIDTDNFPTDRYVVEGIADELGLTVRWIETAPEAGVTADQVAAVLGQRTAAVVLSHVAYRSGHLADLPAITALVHDSGALTVWDLCHSVGVVPLHLDAWGVDLAVGCTYKYLNAGPGSPAFAYVARRHHDSVRQPVQGWMGHRDPFLMGPGYTPADGIRRFISGTPPIVGMLAVRDMAALVGEAGIGRIRSKSQQLTQFAIEAAEALLSGVELASPRSPQERGGHITLRHGRMRDVVAALWQRDILPDYRDPGGLRIGLSPLSTSYAEVLAGMIAIRDALTECA